MSSSKCSIKTPELISRPSEATPKRDSINQTRPTGYTAINAVSLPWRSLIGAVRITTP